MFLADRRNDGRRPGILRLSSEVEEPSCFSRVQGSCSRARFLAHSSSERAVNMKPHDAKPERHAQEGTTATTVIACPAGSGRDPGDARHCRLPLTLRASSRTERPPPSGCRLRGRDSKKGDPRQPVEIRLSLEIHFGHPRGDWRVGQIPGASGHVRPRSRRDAGAKRRRRDISYDGTTLSRSR